MENNGRTVSRKEEFGLCDDELQPKNPAYINEMSPSTWIGIVDNPNLELVGFYGIDHCLILKSCEGEGTQKECDGLLHYNNELIFVELKDRQYRGWAKTACRQLADTISYFKRTSSLEKFNKVRAYVCNKQRPVFNANYNCHIQEFKDETGIQLNIQQRICLDDS